MFLSFSEIQTEIHIHVELESGMNNVMKDDCKLMVVTAAVTAAW